MSLAIYFIGAAMDITPHSLASLDMTCLERAEARLDEVAVVTRFKAPELMSVLNAGYVVAAKARAVLQRQVSLRETAIDALKALIALERAPQYLVEKGLATARSPGGSSDQRDAVIAADPEYQTARNEITELRAELEVYGIRARALEKAFSAVKAIFGDRSTNPYTSAGNEDSQPAPPAHPTASRPINSPTPQPAKRTSGFAQPHYI